MFPRSFEGVLNFKRTVQPGKFSLINPKRWMLQDTPGQILPLPYNSFC